MAVNTRRLPVLISLFAAVKTPVSNQVVTVKFCAASVSEDTITSNISWSSSSPLKWPLSATLHLKDSLRLSTSCPASNLRNESGRLPSTYSFESSFGLAPSSHTLAKLQPRITSSRRRSTSMAPSPNQQKNLLSRRTQGRRRNYTNATVYFLYELPRVPALLCR